MTFWTRHHLTIILALSLTLLSIASLFVGVLDLSSATIDTWELLLISRLPRLLAILMAGMGLAVAGCALTPSNISHSSK